MRIRNSLGLCAIACAIGMPVYAQERQGQERPAALTDLVEQAWTRASAGRLAEGRVNEADASQAVASSAFNGSPSLSLATRTDKHARDRGVEEHDVELAAPLWLPGQRSARSALADAEMSEAQAQVLAARLALAGEVRERVWNLADAQSELAHAELHAQAAQRLEADVARRVSAGDLARTEGLLAKQERLAAMATVQKARSDRAAAAAKLQTLTGSAQLPARYEEAPHSGPLTQEVHPRIAAARLASDRAAKRARFVGSARRDAPEIGVSYRWERGAHESSYDQTVGIGIRIPFASDARNRPIDAAAQTDVATAAAEERAALDEVQADIAAAQAALDGAEQSLLLAEERRAAAQERAGLLKKSFDLGETGLAEWLRVQTEASVAGIAATRARSERGRAVARLNQAQGVLP